MVAVVEEEVKRTDNEREALNRYRHRWQIMIQSFVFSCSTKLSSSTNGIILVADPKTLDSDLPNKRVSKSHDNAPRLAENTESQFPVVQPPLKTDGQ